MKHILDRRQILRGMLAGGAVSVGLPILDAMLNDNGDAFAATGKPLPTRFATWFWPLGFGEGNWVPKTTGADYELPVQMKPLEPFKKKMNLFTGSQIYLDGLGNNTHFSTVQGMMTGTVTRGTDFFGSIDHYIAERIGQGTRFSSFVVCCSGEAKTSWSGRPDSGSQPGETSPSALYARIFGSEYQDPNAATFTPDPRVMLRRSVLSGVSDRRQAIMQTLGAADRTKLDSYFTSLRSLEQKLDIQLQKPDPMPACSKSAEPAQDDGKQTSLAEEALARQDLFTQLFVHAMACDQTRVVNLVISAGLSGLRRNGDPSSHHTYTHEEPVDPATGVQENCSWFQKRYMKALHDYVAAFDGFREGDRTLLDSMLVYAFTDHGAPRYHSMLNYPVIMIGNANGRLKTGVHIARAGETATRISMTAQLAMGVPINVWGTKSNRVTSPIPDVLV